MEQPARRKRDPRQDYDSRMSVTLSTIQELSLEEGDEGRHDEAEFKITTNIKHWCRSYKFLLLTLLCGHKTFI